jgi:VIT1/CCC1 family predicted Fe2+/Mn2+ transporter
MGDATASVPVAGAGQADGETRHWSQADVVAHEAMPHRLEHGHAPHEIATRLEGGPRPSYIRDWVYGGIDGAITTFAIMAGVVGANLSPGVVLVLGVANVLADGLSMAAANYSSTKTEIEEYEHIRRMEERHIEVAPEGEREEVRQIFAAKGFTGEALETAVSIITETKERWVETMMTEEHGLPPVGRDPMRSALATFAAFVLCGAVPILPFALGLDTTLILSAAMTGATFFAIGSLRSRWSPSPWWKAGFETLAIGMAAAGVAYAVGALLRDLV